jgi:hypothetical protein
MPGIVLALAEPEPEAEPEIAAGPAPYVGGYIPADTSAMVAAAQAFAERTRSRVRGLAA